MHAGDWSRSHNLIKSLDPILFFEEMKPGKSDLVGRPVLSMASVIA